MHIPATFKETDQQMLVEFIEEHPFGSLIVSIDGVPHADHLPFTIQFSNDHIRLISHIAKANPLWRHISDGQPALVVFQGPNTYISPNDYHSKLSTNKVVPTWNYAAVHARGHLQCHHDPQWLLNMLNQLTQVNEQQQQHPWRVDDAPANYIDKLSKAIVGIEIRVFNNSVGKEPGLIGQFKLNQNKSVDDRNSVIDALMQRKTGSSHDIAELMKRNEGR